MSPTRASKAIETVEQIEDTSVEPRASSVPQNGGITQNIKVYSMEMKGRVMVIVGSIGDKIVIIKATVYEMGSGAIGKVRQLSLTVQATAAPYLEKVRNTLKAKTVFLQDGYVYMTSAVEGQVMYLKAKVVEPMKSCALSLSESSRKRVDPALQKLKPYYVKFHDGITDFIGTVGERIVVVRAKIFDSSTNMQVWTLESVSGARAVLTGYTSPLLSKAMGLRQSAATRVDHILVSIRDGAVHLKGTVGKHIVHLQTKLSESKLSEQMSKRWQAAKSTTVDLIGKLSEIVSNAYGKGRDILKVIMCSIEDRFLYIVCQVKDRLLVVRIKVAEFAEYLQTRSLELYAATRTSLARSCSGAKTTILNATEVTRTKALKAGTNIRNLVANPDAQAAAAGAMALGASGATTGLFTGCAVGAVCALPAAFFTFGLSVPVGAVVGAGAGGVLGGSAGAVTGSVAGYKAHREKESIAKSISGAFERAKAQKVKTVDSASNLRSHLAARIKGHTGGSVA